jgi:malonyl-CoA O-methyltransferase
MNPVNQFSRNAKSYRDYSTIQRRAARKLVGWGLERGSGERVVDLGCGDGAIYEALRERDAEPSLFVGVDLSEKMLSLHPSGNGIRLLTGDFDDPRLLENLAHHRFDTLYSSSSLQWSRDIDTIAPLIGGICDGIYLSIFADGTFRTFREFAGVPSPIPSARKILHTLDTHLNLVKVEKVLWEMHFENREDIPRYIKRSGVSGGRASLGYSEAKKLFSHYPYDTLEFEILFIEAHGPKSR